MSKIYAYLLFLTGLTYSADRSCLGAGASKLIHSFPGLGGLNIVKLLEGEDDPHKFVCFVLWEQETRAELIIPVRPKFLPVDLFQEILIKLIEESKDEDGWRILLERRVKEKIIEYFLIHIKTLPVEVLLSEEYIEYFQKINKSISLEEYLDIARKIMNDFYQLREYLYIMETLLNQKSVNLEKAPDTTPVQVDYDAFFRHFYPDEQLKMLLFLVGRTDLSIKEWAMTYSSSVKEVEDQILSIMSKIGSLPALIEGFIESLNRKFENPYHYRIWLMLYKAEPLTLKPVRFPIKAEPLTLEPVRFPIYMKSVISLDDIEHILWRKEPVVGLLVQVFSNIQIQKILGLISQYDFTPSGQKPDRGPVFDKHGRFNLPADLQSQDLQRLALRIRTNQRLPRAPGNAMEIMGLLHQLFGTTKPDIGELFDKISNLLEGIPSSEQVIHPYVWGIPSLAFVAAYMRALENTRVYRPLLKSRYGLTEALPKPSQIHPPQGPASSGASAAQEPAYSSGSCGGTSRA